MLLRIASNLLWFLNTSVFRRKEGRTMSWDYRVIRKTTHAMGKTYYSYNLYEVYYDEKGRVVATTEEPVMPAGENIIELMRDFYAMFRAFTLPILEWDLILRNGLELSMHELKQTPTITHQWVPPSKEEMEKIEIEINKERVTAEATYQKECCKKSPAQVFQFMANHK